MIDASAPGKLILCGEHAVVYGRPAIAVPLADIRAYAWVREATRGTGVLFVARDLGRSWLIYDDLDEPLSGLATLVLNYISPPRLPDLQIELTSDIPIASGMGSGAALGTALVRALAGYYGARLTPEQIAAFVYQSEVSYHGTPSGIDNTVVAFERPIWYRRTENREPRTENRGPRTENREPRTEDRGVACADESSLSPVVLGLSSQVGVPFASPPPAVIEPVEIGASLMLLIGDSGLRSPTKLPVGEVRRRWEAEPARYEALFDVIGALVVQVRAALSAADRGALGALLNQNHELLRTLGVSSPELDRLVNAARGAGALGAKLSGAGWGGVMLALVDGTCRDAVQGALLAAGATRVLETVVAAT
jgi:mevalonate kinase